MPLPLLKASKKLVGSALLVSVLAGCNFFRSSELQDAVSESRTSVKHSEVLGQVHRLLDGRRIAHKIVKFRYEVRQRPIHASLGNEYALGSLGLIFPAPPSREVERAGVVYRDDSLPGSPWWYVDGKVRRQIWLPSDQLEQQLSFAMRSPVEIIQVASFDLGNSGMAKDPGLALAPQPDWNDKFRKRHGTEFDPKSPVDVEKMRVLKGA